LVIFGIRVFFTAEGAEGAERGKRGLVESFYMNVWDFLVIGNCLSMSFFTAENAEGAEREKRELAEIFLIAIKKSGFYLSRNPAQGFC
jgi:hypothetical protein